MSKIHCMFQIIAVKLHDYIAWYKSPQGGDKYKPGPLSQMQNIKWRAADHF